MPPARSGDQEESRVAALPIAVGFLVLVAAGVGIWYWANRTAAPSASGPTPVAQRTTPVPQAAPPAGASSEPAANADAPAVQPDSTAPSPDDRPVVPANSPENASTASLEDVVSRASPAVVTIETTDTRGTGFFISADVVVTNAHVVDGHSYVTVKLAHGPSHTGRVTTSTPTYDLALVRVDRPPSGQSVLELAPAGGVRVGQEVVAIGSAMGVFQNSVTRGIVSALRRAGPVLLLQTDAAINPGNSGGPLVDRQGRVIGITTMKIGQEAESIGFAVAADHALALVKGERPSAVPGSGIVSTPGLAPDGSSDANDARESGARDFDRSMQAAAKGAAEVDEYLVSLQVGLLAEAHRACRRSGMVRHLGRAFHGRRAWWRLRSLACGARQSRERIPHRNGGGRRSGASGAGVSRRAARSQEEIPRRLDRLGKIEVYAERTRRIRHPCG